MISNSKKNLLNYISDGKKSKPTKYTTILLAESCDFLQNCVIDIPRFYLK